MKWATSIAMSLFTDRLQRILDHQKLRNRAALHFGDRLACRSDSNRILLAFSKDGNGAFGFDTVWHICTSGSQARAHDISTSQNKFYRAAIDLHSRHNEWILLKQPQSRENVPIFFIEKKWDAVYAIKFDAIWTLRNGHILFFG
jgi:hypothetical protein